jgi:hypothetical protein
MAEAAGARPRILLVSLGGTITMTSGAGAGVVPTLTGADLVRAVPALANVADIEAVSPFRLPGASLTLANLREVARLLNDRLAGDIAGAIVVQETDTIEETAFVLDFLVDSDKPVVVTGAMRSAEAPGADGPANLLASAIVAGSQATCRLGTLVVLNDMIHAARFVQKASTFLPSTSCRWPAVRSGASSKERRRSTSVSSAGPQLRTAVTAAISRWRCLRRRWVMMAASSRCCRRSVIGGWSSRQWVSAMCRQRWCRHWRI